MPAVVDEMSIVILGTGMTSLTIARTLLLSTSTTRVIMLDKANAVGGRASTRTYDSGVLLETGLRNFVVSPKHEKTFGVEVERWKQKGWVREVEASKRRGIMTEGTWYEGVGGVTSLVKQLMSEIEVIGGERLKVHYGITATNPTPVSPSSTPLVINTSPSIDLPSIDYLVHTAPSTQVDQLLSSPPLASTAYIRTLTLLLPTLALPSLPSYWRDPTSSLTSIATGWKSITDSTPQGLIFQASPAQLGVTFEKDVSDDVVVRDAFWRVIRESGLIPEEMIVTGSGLKGRESQVKRWKFAQIVAAVAAPSDVSSLSSGREITVLEGGKVILAGDGEGGEVGGIEGAWRSAQAAAAYLLVAVNDKRVGSVL